MRIEPTDNSLSIVLIGSFNPAIFHPAWFEHNNLLIKEEFQNINVGIIHREIADFKISNWLHVTVMPERFMVITNEPPFVRLSDLVARIFGESLIHTPISQLGINRTVHFSFGDEKTRNAVGKFLAPQEAWGEWAKDLEGDDSKHGGMVSISMRQINVKDREKGHILAKVEPSNLIANGAGVMMEVNDHYEWPEQDVLNGASIVANLLIKQFDTSIQRSEWIIDQIMALKEKL